MLERLEQFLLQRLVLALEVQHRHLYRGGIRGIWHGNMVAAKPITQSRDGVLPRLRQSKFGRRELKRFVNRYIVDTLRGLAAPGLPAPSPLICLITRTQHVGIQPS